MRWRSSARQSLTPRSSSAVTESRQTSLRSPHVLHVVPGVPLPPSETFIVRRLVGEKFEPSVLYYSSPETGHAVDCRSFRVAAGRRLQWPEKAPRCAAIARRADAMRIIARQSPDVVHAHFGPLGCQVDRQCHLLDVPLVVTFYGYDVGSAPRDDDLLAAYQRMFASGAVCTGEGPALLERLRALGVPEPQTRLLPLCLPSWAMNEPIRQVPWNSGPLRLLQVARFTEKKGIDLTLQALSIARKQGVDARLELIGDGPLRPELDTLVSELKLGRAVSRPGFLPYDQLCDALARSHAFLQPSRTAADGDTEGGHPTTLIESLAQSVPVLATHHADIPFAVLDGQTGHLVPEEDAQGLATHIVRLDRDRDALVGLSIRARRTILRRHDPRRLRRLRERIYREAIRGRQRSRLVSRLALTITGSIAARGR